MSDSEGATRQKERPKKKRARAMSESEVLEIARRYPSVRRWQFSGGEGGRSYRIAKKKGNEALYEACKRAIREQNPNPREARAISLRDILLSTRGFLVLNQWRRASPRHEAFYRLSIKNGWLFEVKKRFKMPSRPQGYWTKERCHGEALRFETKTQWRGLSRSSYDVAYQNGWLEELSSHMAAPRRWTREAVIEERKKYGSLQAFMVLASGAYRAAKKKGWLSSL